mmetsp:Transcript_5787/g.12216  ORF Transcript_5787/g.12216 Transcript_5787/m.12216 type:complete len:226 (+) Transcript_5787:1143-1820(+)
MFTNNTTTSMFLFVLVVLEALCSGSMVAALSQPSATLPDKATQTTENTIFDVSVNGIRPELSKNSYAHQSAIGCDYGTIDIRVSSQVRGLGAFATRDIPLGTFLGYYNGETMVLSEVKARFWSKATKTQADLDWETSRIARGQGVTGHFLFELPNGSFVDAEDAEVSSWIRFMNHEKAGTKMCNVKAFIKAENDDDEAEFPLMYAIEDIKVGEELCWDYGGQFFK